MRVALWDIHAIKQPARYSSSCLSQSNPKIYGLLSQILRFFIQNIANIAYATYVVTKGERIIAMIGNHRL